MTDTAFPDFDRPRRYIRLDTILRLRWLAALGQLAAIFFVVQSLDFDVPIIPCVAIIAASAVVTGGFRLGMTMARPNTRAVSGSTLAMAAPSRKWMCQSSGRAIIRVSVMSV